MYKLWPREHIDHVKLAQQKIFQICCDCEKELLETVIIFCWSLPTHLFQQNIRQLQPLSGFRFQRGGRSHKKNSATPMFNKTGTTPDYITVNYLLLVQQSCRSLIHVWTIINFVPTFLQLNTQLKKFAPLPKLSLKQIHILYSVSNGPNHLLYIMKLLFERVGIPQISTDHPAHCELIS